MNKVTDRSNPRHRDGRPVNGVIRPQMEVHCAGCERAYLGLGETVSNATVELRRGGWKSVRGLWTCDRCAA
jgi:hypothetical protein